MTIHDKAQTSTDKHGLPRNCDKRPIHGETSHEALQELDFSGVIPGGDLLGGDGQVWIDHDAATGMSSSIHGISPSVQ